MPALLLLSCVTLGKSFHLSEPQFKAHVLGSEDTMEFDPILSSLANVCVCGGDKSNIDHHTIMW